jgi:hypothetical protein
LPICGKVTVATYPVAERLGLVWVYLPIAAEEPHPVDDQLPEELRGAPFVLGGRIQDRTGNWRFACENGYDEGHAKYLHRTSLWRVFKAMPVWNTTRIERRGRWIYRVQVEQFWEADFPGLGRWSNQAWWKLTPPVARAGGKASNVGNTGAASKVDPVIAAQQFPGFASVSMPGVLRITYPKFIHYEFYVPVDAVVRACEIAPGQLDGPLSRQRAADHMTGIRHAATRLPGHTHLGSEPSGRPDGRPGRRASPLWLALPR